MAKKASPTSSKKTPKATVLTKTKNVAKKPFSAIKSRTTNFLARRPHRSFRRTKRRDHHRSLKLPSYIDFTKHVNSSLWKNKKIFIGLTIVYAVLTAFLVGIASQDTYTSLSDTLRDTGDEIFSGNFAELGKASVLFAAAITGAFSGTLSTDQQIFAGLIGLLTWLTTVWLLRNILAGHKVKLRDGVYSAGSPIISTFIVFLVMIVQLLPMAVALLGIAAAAQSGILNGGVEAMLFWVAAALLIVLSLFWITSTFIAAVVVTLPGMYPFKALSVAGDLVTGRRFRILLRLTWMALTVVLTWALVMIPVILLDTWLKGLFSQLAGLPIMPITILLLSSFTVVWVSSYVYLLYRRIVEDDAAPA
jgi:hypothetical protein